MITLLRNVGDFILFAHAHCRYTTLEACHGVHRHQLPGDHEDEERAHGRHVHQDQEMCGAGRPGGGGGVGRQGGRRRDGPCEERLLRGKDGGEGDRVRVQEQARAAQVGAGHHGDAQPPRQQHEHRLVIKHTMSANQ